MKKLLEEYIPKQNYWMFYSYICRIRKNDDDDIEIRINPYHPLNWIITSLWIVTATITHIRKEIIPDVKQMFKWE